MLDLDGLAYHSCFPDGLSCKNEDQSSIADSLRIHIAIISHRSACLPCLSGAAETRGSHAMGPSHLIITSVS